MVSPRVAMAAGERTESSLGPSRTRQAEGPASAVGADAVADAGAGADADAVACAASVEFAPASVGTAT
jgi:hypothetical protein